MVISFYGITITTEYDALSRMGIDNPKGYIEKRYASGGKVTLLVTCAVGEAVVTQVEAAVEEAQSSGSWVDVMVSTVQRKYEMIACSPKNAVSSLFIHVVKL